jgi:hypothetical protein
MQSKLRHFFVGMAIGIITPIAAFYVFYSANYSHIPFAAYVKMLLLRSMLSKVLAVSAVPNLLCFYLCLWLNRDNAARGVVCGTMLTAILMMVVYFLF